MAYPANDFSKHKVLKSKKHLRKPRRSTKTIDSMAYFFGVFGNIAVVPQIIKAWQSDAPGLAISTWMLFSLMSMMWLYYAFAHNQKPLIVAQGVGLTCNILVVSGWLINNLF